MAEHMRIGIDVSLLLYPEVVGMRIYFERLLDAMLRLGGMHEYVFFHHTRRAWHGTEPLERFVAPNVTLQPAPLPIRCIPDSAWWLGVDPPLAPLLRTRVDVFHAGEFMWPRSRTTPLVATLYDLTPELFPEMHVWPNRVRHGRQLRWMMRHARRVLSISQSSADDFQRLFGEGPAIDVVHPGSGLDVSNPDMSLLGPLRQRLGIGDDPFVLSVGTVEPRKNGERLVHAFTRACEGRSDAPHLVFAGVRGWHSDAVYAAAAASPLAPRIHFTGRLTTPEVVALYHGADALLYPSLYEGFGLPVLEAMQAGTAVLTSATSSMPEIAGDACILVDPRSVDDIARGIVALQDTALRERLARQGRERAAHFSWERAASLTLASYAAACGKAA